MAGTGGRVLLAAGAFGLALLGAEGAVSLATGRSLVRALLDRGVLAEVDPASPFVDARLGGPAAGRRADAGAGDASERGLFDGDGDGEGALAAPDAPPGARGDLYTAHDDPLVGYVLWPDADLAIYDGAIRTDALGLRSRPGGPPPPDALRVVVLGDSVAFGLGVDDDEALAHRLELALTAMRGPGARPVACRTVAVPSWNHRSAAAFLLDHWDVLDPDIVIYLPCRNDVFDIDGAYPSGLRRVMPDPSSPDPWLNVSVRSNLEGSTRRLAQGPDATLPFDALGAVATDADLSPESTRRLDENADGIALLASRLSARDGRLLVVWTTTDHYTWLLSERLAARAPGLPVTALLEYTRNEFTLGFDPHFNPTTLDVWGRWLAEDLIARGWLPGGEGHALPAVPEEYAALRFTMPPASEWPRLAEEARARWRACLLPEVDWRTGRGLLQVYGGCNLDGSARSRVLVLLGPGGGSLELLVGPIDARPDLYPLAVDVEVDGVPAGRVVVDASGPTSVRLPLPAGVDRDAPHELRLSPERWTVVGAPDAPPGTRQLVSFRPLRAACTDG